MKKYVELTEIDRKILESYKSVVDGLSVFLGSSCEIILHSLEYLDHSAIKVMNGHYTNREEGAPITDLALRMLSNMKDKKGIKKNMVYMNKNNIHSKIKAATLPIIGTDDKIIGLICINSYLDIPLDMWMEDWFTAPDKQNGDEEVFVKNAGDLLTHSIEKVYQEVKNNNNISNMNRNKEIVKRLNQMEIFNFKDSVEKVAEYLGISKNTVYLHLRSEKNNKL